MKERAWRKTTVRAYDRFRRVRRMWSEDLMAVCPDEYRLYFSKLMGMTHHHIVVIEAPHELDVLEDFSIFGFPARGPRVIDVFVEEHRDAPGLAVEERRWLEAMSRDWFGVFELLRGDPGLGVYAKPYEADTDEEVLIVDRHLSEHMRPGLLLAARLVQLDDWFVQTGGAFPVDEGAFKFVPSELRALYRRERNVAGVWPPAARRRFETELFRAAHRAGLTGQMITM